jgi:hypothetical protein
MRADSLEETQAAVVLLAQTEVSVAFRTAAQVDLEPQEEEEEEVDFLVAAQAVVSVIHLLVAALEVAGVDLAVVVDQVPDGLKKEHVMKF